MADAVIEKTSSTKLSLNVREEEFKALAFIRRIHPSRYEGVSSVIRDYSLKDAVNAWQLAGCPEDTADDA